MGRAGRDPQIFAQAHFLVEKSCFQAQKKSTRKKQKITNAAAIDGGEEGGTQDHREADAPVESIEFPWRKKLNPGVRRYAATQHPDCRRDTSDRYFGNPPRERAHGTHPTTPPHQLQRTSSSPATTPNHNHKRGRRAATSDSDAGPKRRGGHLAECKEILERWETEIYERDWAGKGFTSDMFMTDTMITYLAHTRFSSLVHLRESLQSSTRSWGLVDDYGDDILRRLAHVDQRRDDERRQLEAERLQRQLELQEKGRSVKQKRGKQLPQPGFTSGS
ncbi:hypothetical protein R3P38DRAFT_2768618 [Favolaschia claudopus]|uniref:Uncharacterized protein n=1 Tax=Favolaschia claudopus TaxID=2862362 RepID=A0AAW0CQE5_9AGAR